MRASNSSHLDPATSPIIAVGVEATAPRLWKRLPQERREEVAFISRLLSTTQEFANSGFPEGTNHGLSHIAGVLKRADELVSHLRSADFNGIETYLLILAILLHDSALFRGREGHANATRILEVINTLQLPIDYPLRAPIARIAASHSGSGRIEELPESPALVSTAMHRADLRAIAAVLRLSDEIAEDALRTSAVVLKSTHSMSLPFHEFSAAVFCGFEFRNGLGSILIQMTCEEGKLSSLVGEPDKPRTLLAHFLDRCLKIEAERQYCSRFLPKGIRLDSTRLKILDTLSSQPWLDSLVPTSSRNLRAITYNAKPSLLFPSLNSQNSSGFETDLIFSLRECLGDSLVSIAGDGGIYWIILEGDGCPPAGAMLDLIGAQLRTIHGTSVLLRAITLRDLIADVSIGIPEIIRLALRGRCLLSSNTFEAIKRIVAQPLRFTRDALMRRLASECTLILEQVELAKSLLEQVHHCHRLIMTIGQTLIIRAAQDNLTASTLVGLSETKGLSRYLKRSGVNSELRALASRVDRDHRSLMGRHWHAAFDPQEFYLDAAYAWFSLLDAPCQR